MARLLHRLGVFEQAISADGVTSFDLPVNPLSVILLALRPLNETSTITNFQSIFGVAGSLDRVTVLWRGASLFSMSGADVVAYNYFRHGIVPPEVNHDDVDNDRRCLVLPIILGRFAYDSSSCIPNSHRGELTLELDVDIADTGYDGYRLSAETIELVGARPTEIERKVTLSQTWAATGDNDLQIPVGNLLRGAMLFGTTSFVGGSPAPSWGRTSLYVDGEQRAYASTDFEVAHAISSLMGRQPPRFDTHTHRVDATSASTTEETVGGSIEVGSGSWTNYAFMDLDPTRDDEFAVDLKVAQTCFLRSDAETADAVRAVTIEKMSVSQLA